MPETTYWAGGRFSRSQNAADIGGRFIGHVQPRVAEGGIEKFHEGLVGLDGDQVRIRVHAAQDLGGDGADAGAVFHDHPGAFPVDGSQDLVDQVARTGPDRAQHEGMAEEIQREQQPLGEGRMGCYRHVGSFIRSDGTTCLILRDSMGAIIRAHGLLRLETIAEEPGAAAHRAAAAGRPGPGAAGAAPARLGGAVLCATGLAALWVLATPIAADSLVRWAERYPALDPAQVGDAQAIVILAGGVRVDAPEYGTSAPGATSLERLVYGARLARQTHLPVLISGSRLEAASMTDFLQQDLGVTPNGWRTARAIPIRMRSSRPSSWRARGCTRSCW